MQKTKSKKQKIFIICGPTASGKSNIAVNCAQRIGGEIISADSVQIYKGLDIGSGKITTSEMFGIKHHMLDILEPYEPYSVSDYLTSCKNIINDISYRGKIPIITGGTGLYIKCLLEGHNFGNAQRDDQIRRELNDLLENKGKEYLYERLKNIDPISASKIAINDSKRVIRALEIYETTGIPKSAATKISQECEYEYKIIVLYRDREVLYDAINLRVDNMFLNGLENEVISLLKYSNCQSMQSIGYKETAEYLIEKKDLEETKIKIKINTRHYAKRQLTFFKGLKQENVWLNSSHKHIMSDIFTYLNV